MDLLTPRRRLDLPAASVLALVLALMTLVPLAGPAFACDTDGTQNDGLGSANAVITCDKEPTSAPTPADSGSSQGSSSGPVAVRHCFFGTKEVPCTLSGGFHWSDTGLCYEAVVDPPLPADDPAWEGHTDGVVIECLDTEQCVVQDDAVRIGCQLVKYRWAPKAPWETGPAASEVAQHVVASMQLRAGQIGMAPPSFTERPNSKFVVGIQAWLWVDDPGEHTTGPITRTATEGGVTVTATAKLDRIEYDMGDGGTLTCHGPGTRYSPAWGDADSPDCGYMYTQPSTKAPQGIYTITAHSYWNVDWSGPNGEHGVIPVDLATSVPVKVGEIQVLVKS